MSWFIEALKKYAVFSGRARRKEYWLFFLFAYITYIVFAGIGAAAHAVYLVAIPALAFLLPGLAVTVRRLHDTGRSGWMILLGLIPLVGPIILLVFYCSDSAAGANKYGPNPKEAAVLA
ncbi:uncharacterized membrane protein YhaH (DUF805 family) [Streptomyces griseochromogenes]|uniref:Uncharacterized membrane protein YhaH (DUF805 family) n=1 Tax=Streptomyces griseochromogenes TaxID=68214 RepID=A0A1B1AQ67_9ACTN|nr:DUF805 domain-containing protein [Streptomyces griseochromogenes]ANP48711.1 hypothetical protein AVL59_03205 [Streptomyces griseochromogenes]MBP2054140.1 uncharacterized membrane protein YhaH (DUF805 family) [Streptomyces griseochromogenes]